MIAATAGALLSHWRRAPLNLLTLLAGLALATALWSGVQAINAEARASYDAAAETLGGGRFDVIVSRDGGAMQNRDFVALRRAGWLVSPVIEGTLAGQRLVGIDPLSAPDAMAPVSIGQGADIAGFLGGAGQIFGRAEVLDALAPALGAPVPEGLVREGPVREGPVREGSVPERIISPDIAPQMAITDIGTAQRLLGRSGEIDRMLVIPAQPLRQAALARIAPALERRAARNGAEMARLTDSFHLNLTAFGLLSFAVGIFIVQGAVGLSFAQRAPVIRSLRALGVPLWTLLLLVAAELLAFALLAGAAGVGIGYLIASALLPDVAATLRGLYGAEVPGTLQLRLGWWASGLGVATAGTALAAGAAFWRLARMPVLAATQPFALSMRAGRAAWVQGGAAAALSVGAVMAGTLGSGLLAGFALLAGLLIGAALALPLVLRGLLALAERRARGAAAQWFWADARQQLPGLSLALMALLLAMAANVGVTTMVSSFRLTFTGFLDQRLASELYVTAPTPAQAAAMQEWLTPRVSAVLPVRAFDAPLRGLPGEVFGVRDHATYRDNWAFLDAAPGAWDAIAAGQGAAINEQAARRSGMRVGDTVKLRGAAFEVVGIYGDYGNPLAQAMIGAARHRALAPEVQATRFGLRLPPGEVGALRDALAEWGGARADMVDQARLKALSLEVFERTFSVTAALNVLTLAVAGFAILMSLLTLASLRLPLLAPVWAVGFTRAGLAWAELLRAVMLAFFTALLALPLGLLLAWVLLAVVNVAAFGWRLPMFVFPLQYAQLGLAAMTAALLAALWPALRLARIRPAELLKVFSNER